MGHVLTTHVVKELESMVSCQLGSTTTFLPLDKVLPRQLSSHYVNGATSCWQPHSNRSRDWEVSDAAGWRRLTPTLTQHGNHDLDCTLRAGCLWRASVPCLCVPRWRGNGSDNTQPAASWHAACLHKRPVRVDLRLNAVSAQQQFKPRFSFYLQKCFYVWISVGRVSVCVEGSSDRPQE